ncbi:hypothetical protein Q5M87_05015, partial [Brachyspira innocens]|nr:hypothetical protein [Brachyspira innocens]MDO7019407.1 hypothetical protein [Brachyspira innocens]
MNLFDKNRLNTGLNGEWLNDDEENGIHGTVLMAEDMNSLGTEINNLIKAGGMTPNKNENDQILKAVKNLGGSGVSSSASNVSYDNSISSLQQKNYDFPKFKSTIDDLTYISLTESSVMGKIEKEEDNYFLKGNVSVTSNQNVLPILLTIEGKEGYEVLSFIAQFFNIDYETRDIENLNWTDALENEIIVNGINNGWQFVFVQNTLGIKRKDNGEIPENTYSVTLNIKNRVLLKPDENIIAWQYGINNGAVLKIVNENGNTKIKGITNTYSSVRSGETIFFTNNILENYITLDTEHTIGIKSSSGKNVIWTLKKSSNYTINIKYADGSQIQSEDFFTIDITPDKNSNIDFTKGDAVNVQNAIDSLSELKQNKLTAGENIVIEKQGESTIIKSLGGGNAENISFDNTNAKLQQLAGYDFPRFKVSIPDTINLTFKDEILGNGAVSSASIVKENNEYRLKGNITAEIRNSEDFPFSFTIDNITNDYEQYSTISQFFNFTDDYSFSSEYISADSGEITIAGVDKEYQFKFVYSNSYSSKCKLYITTKDGSDINGTYTISLNIKNRVLKPEDRNIFAVNSNFQQNIIASLCNLGLNQTGSSVKLQGTFTSSIYNVGTSDGLFFYSPIIENYFNLSDGINLTNTTGITSSTGKACKFGITKISDTPADNISKYVLSVAYQDGSSINQGDVFTFNLTPDKNFTLNPIYQDVRNVQQLGEVLNDKDLELEKKIDVLSSLYMIPAYYTQYANASGVFD